MTTDCVKSLKYDEVMKNKENDDIWINCVMLVRWPLRKEMIHEAIVGFIAQDYPKRILTIVNDG